jgi:hypothetical protein
MFHIYLLIIFLVAFVGSFFVVKTSIDSILGKTSLLVWALIGVPAVFAFYVESTYRYALSRGGLPLNILPEWLWFIVFGLSILSGAVTIGLIRFKEQWKRIITIAGYIVTMIALLLMIHLFVACINGDCL